MALLDDVKAWVAAEVGASSATSLQDRLVGICCVVGHMRINLGTNPRVFKVADYIEHQLAGYETEFPQGILSTTEFMQLLELFENSNEPWRFVGRPGTTNYAPTEIQTIIDEVRALKKLFRTGSGTLTHGNVNNWLVDDFTTLFINNIRQMAYGDRRKAMEICLGTCGIGYLQSIVQLLCPLYGSGQTVTQMQMMATRLSGKFEDWNYITTSGGQAFLELVLQIFTALLCFERVGQVPANSDPDLFAANC